METLVTEHVRGALGIETPMRTLEAEKWLACGEGCIKRSRHTVEQDSQQTRQTNNDQLSLCIEARSGERDAVAGPPHAA